ncbi:MAG: DUF2244 domain-containing protein [Granulosicoccus sp.]|nr:DUF2244 domain-containing protein [Granulosicoccus sp.]
MIEVQDQANSVTRLIVQGNQSMSWRANLYLAASFGVICMGIALAMAAYGLWMVIPFAGAEVIFIIVCLYLTLKRLSRKEVITVDNDAIKLEWGYNTPDITVRLPRRWSRISYRCSDNIFEVGDLSVSAHGKQYALGKCLNRDEKKTLYIELQAALGR